MSIATELTTTGAPRVLYLSRGDVSTAGGGHSELYVRTLRNALVAHAEGQVVQPLKPYLRAQGKDGHIADRIIAMPAHLSEPGVWHAELGEVLTGWRPGRESDDEIIVLTPMGMAVEDIACAAEIYTRARQQRIGTWLDLY